MPEILCIADSFLQGKQSFYLGPVYMEVGDPR